MSRSGRMYMNLGLRCPRSFLLSLLILQASHIMHVAGEHCLDSWYTYHKGPVCRHCVKQEPTDPLIRCTCTCGAYKHAAVLFHIPTYSTLDCLPNAELDRSFCAKWTYYSQHSVHDSTCEPLGSAEDLSPTLIPVIELTDRTKANLWVLCRPSARGVSTRGSLPRDSFWGLHQ